MQMGVLLTLATAGIGVVLSVIVGLVAWRWKRGDFYKAVAEEKTDEVKQLRAALAMRPAEDITPILETLKGVTDALNRHADMTERSLEVTEQVFAKVADMNGSLRATTSAMEALGNRLILDEAARALLATAAERNAP